MAKEMTYNEKLKDPRWQKKRLEILQRDEFTCQYCNDNSSMLIVHHKYYIYDKEPWDYPNNALLTLCNNCHIIEGEHSKFIEKDFIIFLYNLGLTSNELMGMTINISFPDMIELSKNEKIDNIIQYFNNLKFR